MATNVDQRIVEMQFDNVQFEKGVNTSLQSLENLKKGFNFDSITNSLSNIEKSFNKFDLGGLSSSIDEIKSHFTVLGRNIDTIVDNIVQSATSKLKSIFTSISVDQVGAGFSKYETQTKAVQTITNATGKSVEEVNGVLAKLQKYTDETSYDFAEMASTIGKFTSVGVELSRAETAMEGIANVAAVSGAGKAEANRAMYNFAQSLSQGSVKLMDWKSIENANMATKEFKEELIKTAIELGTINKVSETSGKIMTQTKAATKKAAAQFKETAVDYKTFNSTLSDGWLTSDVLIATLERYANKEEGVGKKAFEAAQKALTFTDAMDAIKDAVSSTWMQSFQYIFGDLNEAINLWTNFCNAIIEVTDAIGSYRNELLEGWHTNGGYTAMIEAASNAWSAFRNVLDLVRDSFNNIIPPATSQTLIDITNKIKEASETLANFFNYKGSVEVEEEVEKLINYATEFEDTIKSGMSGDYVKLFQQALINAGYTLDKFGADGIYGTETKNAIKKLQKDLGISQTGEWDEATKKATLLSGKFQTLEKVTETVTKNVGDVYYELEEVEGLYNYAHLLPSTLLKEGDKSEAVKTLQDALVKAGRLDSTLANGVYGPETKAAVEQLQREFNMVNLSEYGMWDYATQQQAQALEIFTETTTATKKVKKEVGAQNSYMERLQSVIEGLAARWSIFTNLISLGGRIIKHVISLFSPVADAILTIASVIGKCWVSLNNYLNETGAYEKWFNNVKKFLEPVGKVLQSVGDSINAFFERHSDIETFTDLWDAIISEFKEISIIKTLWSKVEPVAKAISTFFSNVKSAIVQFFNADTSEGETILDKLKIRFSAFSSIGDWISKTFSNPFTGLTDEKKNGLIAFLKWIFNGIGNILKMVTKMNFGQLLTAALGIFAAVKVFKAIQTLLSPVKMMKNLSGMFGSIGDFFETSTKSIKSKNSFDKKLIRIAASLMLVSVAIAILASLDSKKAWSAVGMIAALGVILVGLSVAMEKFAGNGVSKSTKGLLKLSVGLILIAAAVSILAKLPTDSLVAGIAAIGVILLEIVAYSKLMGNDTKITGFISLAAGVLLLTVSLKKLAQMSWSEMIKGLVGLGAVLLELAIFVKITGGNGLNTGLMSMIGVGVAVYLLTLSLKSLSDMSWESIAKGLASLGAVLLELSVFIKIVNGAKSAGLFQMVGIGIAVTLIAKSFKELGDMTWDGILKGMAALGVIFLELAVFINLIKKNNPFSMIASVIAVAGIGAALMLYVKSIKDLARIKTGPLIKGIIALGAIFLEIAVFMKLIKKNKPVSMLASIVGMIAIGAALKMYIDSIKVLASIDTGSLLKGIIALGVLFAEIGLLIKSLSGTSFSIGSILAIISSAALMLVFGETLKKVADVPWGSMVAFGATFALVITSISSALTMMSFIPVTGAITATANLAIFIAGLMAVFTAIAGLDSLTNGGLSDWLNKGAQVLGSALGNFIASIIKPIMGDNSKSETKSIADMLNGMISDLNGVMDQLEPFLNRVSSITEDQVNGVANLVKVLALMSGEEIIDSISGWISSALNGGEGSGSGFVDFAQSLVEVAPLLKQFAEESGGINTYNLKVASIAMGYFSDVAIATLPLAGTEVLDSIAAFISGDDNGSAIISFAEKLVDLAPHLVSFGELAKNINTKSILFAVSGVEAFCNIAVATLPLAGVGVLDSIAAFISGESGKSAIIDFAAKLVMLAPLLATFGDLAKNINAKSILFAVPAIEAFCSIASATGALVWADLISNIASYITGSDSFISFSEKLIALVPKLYELEDVIGDEIDETKITSLVPIVDAFGQLATTAAGITWAELISGIGDFLTGKDSFLSFADKMVELGPKLITLGNTLDGMDETKVKNMQSAASVLSAFASVANEIPGTDGLVQKVFGEHDIGDFGAKLETLGKGLFNFYDATKDIPSDYSSDGYINTLSALAQVAQDIPGAGGFIQSILGEKSLETFGSQLKTLGDGLYNFYDSTKDIPSDYSSDALVTALKGLVGIAKEVPGAGGFVQAIVGEKSLEEFGGSLNTLGTGLNDFAIATKDIPSDYNAEAPLAVLTALSDLESGLEAQGGLTQWLLGEKNLGEFGVQIGTLGDNLSKFFNSTEGLDAQKLKDIGDALDALSGAVVSTPDSQILASGIGGLQYILDSLTELDYTGFVSSGNEIIAKILSGAQSEIANPDKKIGFTKIGGDILSYISSGMSSDANIQGIKTAISGVVNTAKTEITNKYNDFYNAGNYLDQGLVVGIWKGSSAVSTTAWNVAVSAYNAACRALGIASPSKEFAKIGMFADMGLINGLETYSDAVQSSASDVASGAIDGARQGLSDFYSTVFDDISDEPVIRPVLDLSEVQTGVADMNGMFGEQTIAVRSANIASTIATGVERNEMTHQQETNNSADIRGSIEMLNARIDELGQRIMNMKVVTETGAIIGAIAPGMDRALGNRSILAKRGAI